jgi:alkyl hydroperoxide reductase subunit AhpC
MVQIGEKVPEFEVPSYNCGEFENIKLGNYKGKWIVLFFYPADFTFVCPTEIRSFALHHKEFLDKDAVVIGASTDSVYSHKAWFEKDLPEVRFPIIADTTHSLSRMLGVLKESSGQAFRATLIIDPEGNLRFFSVNDMDVGRSVEEILRTLAAFQTGGLCPANWHPGEKTLSS